VDLSRLFGRKTGEVSEERGPDGQVRLPPGQYETKKWPVLSYEATPRFDSVAYRFKVWGEVEDPFELTWDELQALPRTQLRTDIHCVTTWSRYDNDWEGVHIREILQRARPKESARFVMAHSFTGYTTNLPLSALDDDDVMIALSHDGAPLAPELYFYKSAKWLNGLEFMEKDRPGFWEVRGYSNSADPWKEERYW
jgi:DMSO/TMAO reductase YedYZ molybdopterin-dependent catalytic subunit